MSLFIELLEFNHIQKRYINGISVGFRPPQPQHVAMEVLKGRTVAHGYIAPQVFLKQTVPKQCPAHPRQLILHIDAYGGFLSHGVPQ